MKKLILILPLLVLGCATEQPLKWNKQGATQADYNRDISACEYDVAKHPNQDDPKLGIFGQALEKRDHDRNLFVLCMKSKEWYLSQ